MPVLHRWQQEQRAYAALRRCPSNLRRIGQALVIHANEHGGVFPATLDAVFGEEYLTPDVFVCPVAGDTPAVGSTPAQVRAQFTAGGHISYVYVGAGLTTANGSDYVVAYDRPQNHGGDGANVLLADGHVDWFAMPAFQRVLDEVAAGRVPVRIPTSSPAPVTQPTTRTER
jgi:prepilin-type processing-associated H-X9-DG protein